MNLKQRNLASQVVGKLLPRDEFERLRALALRDIGFGFDQFGMEKESVLLGYVVARLLYKHWFRVDSAGHENIPLTGRALLTPNHSGVLPIDGALIWCDLLHKLPTPRSMRAVVDNFMGFLPFVNTMMYRTGQVVGARRNFQDLLEAEELVTVFPEGAKGTGKLFKDRYRMIRFNVGFIELSLSYRAPIIPTAVVGGEEQAPMLYDLKPIARLFAFPYFPVTPFFPWLGPLGVIPLPVKYHLRYGKPLRFYEQYPPEAIHQPEVVRRLADEVQATVDGMLQEGLRQRTSIFGWK